MKTSAIVLGLIVGLPCLAFIIPEMVAEFRRNRAAIIRDEFDD